MPKHPIEDIIAEMPRRDQEIANRLSEAGFSDEDLYAALPTPGLERLLRGSSRSQAKRKKPITPSANAGEVDHG